MQEETEIFTETVNQARFFIVFLSFALGCLYMSGYLAATFRAPNVFLIGLVLFVIIPLILIKRILLFFTKRVKIIFSEHYFSLVMMKLNTESIISESRFSYQNIRSCIVNSASVKTSSIDLYTINEGKKKYIFNNLKGDDVENVGESIYTNIKTQNPDVILRPTFFGSNNGKVFTIGIAILLTILLFLHIFYSPKTSPFTFLISVSIYFNIWAQRKKDIERFERLSIIA